MLAVVSGDCRGCRDLWVSWGVGVSGGIRGGSGVGAVRG